MRSNVNFEASASEHARLEALVADPKTTVNIASMNVLMQLVQVVDSMREGQCVIMDALERMSDDGGGSQDALTAARQASAETDALATELSKKLQTLVQRVEQVNVRHGA